MTAVFFAPVSLPWPLTFVALLFTAIGIFALIREGGKRAIGLAVAVGMAVAMVEISDEVCRLFPWLLECWCKWCL